MNAVISERARIDDIVRQWPAIDDTPESSITSGPPSSLHHLVTWLHECHERSRQRGHLQMLDDRLLQDVGLTAADVGAELAKWPWMK
jgi:uncharacterized protein YjiS (DUF1127 family)